jgi:putative cell wall-binding protein
MLPQQEQVIDEQAALADYLNRVRRRAQEQVVEEKTVLEQNDWRTRVVEEKTALDEKIERLTQFQNGDATLSTGEHGRLARQKAYMLLYSRVLRERIDEFQRLPQ